jgi:hypothetical protein
VHGDVLVGRASHAIDGPGWFYDDGEPDPGAVAGDVLGHVFVPLDDGYLERRLVRSGSGVRWSTAPSRNAGDDDGDRR